MPRPLAMRFLNDMTEVGAFLLAALQSPIFWGTVTGLGTLFLAITALVMYTKSRRSPRRSGGAADYDDLVLALMAEYIGAPSDPYHSAVDYAAERAHITYAIDWLQEQARNSGDRQRVVASLESLRAGDTRPAEAILKTHMDIARNEGNNAYAGWMARHLGAIASVRDLNAAMAAYSEATATDPTEPDAWNRVGLLYRRNGQYDEAAEVFEKVLSLVSSAENPSACATAASNLGLIHRARDEIDLAADRFIESLSLNEVLNDRDGMIRDYSNLGFLYDGRGDLEKAEALHRKALSLAEDAGRQEAVADALTNLGLVLEARDDLQTAVDAYRKSAALNEELGRAGPMAAALSNLGMVLQQLDDFEQAELCHRRSLSINEDLGDLESLAADHGNLGVVYQMRGEFEAAEASHRRALKINEDLGRREGMANQYGNLGLVYQNLGRLDTAAQCFSDARDLFVEIGDREKAEQTEELMSQLES